MSHPFETLSDLTGYELLFLVLVFITGLLVSGLVIWFLVRLKLNWYKR